MDHGVGKLKHRQSFVQSNVVHMLASSGACRGA